MPSPLVNLKTGLATDADIVREYTAYGANGAIAVREHTAFITKGTAAAMTLAAPSTAQNGIRIRVVSTTAAAHTVTQTTPGFNNASTSGDVATFGAAIGNSITMIAYGGVWHVESMTGVTLA